MNKGGTCRRADRLGRGRIDRLPIWKKILFGLIATVALLCLLEIALALVGVRRVVDMRDPYVGFAANVPLYVEREDSNGRVVMTTAQNKLAYFNAQQFPRRKPPGTYRIFCLGGSTTYGRPYDDVTSFPGWLRELLPVADPTKKWEVINAGGISYASYRVAAVMEEVAQFQPDLFIVYTGHNEFLEERTYRDMRSASPTRLQFTAALAKTHTFAIVNRLIGRDQRDDTERELLPTEVDAVLDHTVGPSKYHRNDRLREQVLQHFELNLTRMAAIANACAANLIFVTPAANIKDFSPFKSEHSKGLPTSDIRQWTEHFQQGKKLHDDGNPGKALAAFETSARIDDRYAELRYRKAQVFFESERFAEASAEFQRAVDEDVCPLRALSEIPKLVRETAQRLSVSVVDFESLLKNDCLRNHGHNTPGREYFLDHVHPNIAANRMLAVAIIGQLNGLGTVQFSKSWSDSTVVAIARRVESTLDAQTHAVALRNLAKVLNWAGKHYEAGPLALEALETLPDDPESLFLSAAYLKMTGKTEQAIENYRKTLEHNPDYAEAHQLLGAALVEKHKYEAALNHFKHAVRIHPDDVDAIHMVGAVLAELNSFEEALTHYHRALTLKPNDANIHFNLAFALAKLGRPSEAIAQYKQTITLNPDDADAYNNLGVLLVQNGRVLEAIDHYRKALELKPDICDAKINLLIAIEKRQRIKDGESPPAKPEASNVNRSKR